MNLVILFVVCLGLLVENISSNSSIFSPFNGNTTLQWISSDVQFSGFYNLIRPNSEARNKFVEEEMTIFIPTNEALANHQASLYADFGLYHMASTSKDTSELKRTSFLTSVNKNLPKLWISNNGNVIYVNNAKVVSTSYFSTSKSVDNKILTQSLFMIDQLLDPMIRAPLRPQTVYNLLISPEKWSLDETSSISLFKSRVQEEKLENLFHNDEGNTYFLPIDKGINPQQFHDINNYSIRGHIVPNTVLFTRPTPENVYYETLANDKYVYVVLSFVVIDNKQYIKSRTIVGSDENPKGESFAEILQPNIPVANGVVHLISEPLGIYQRKLKPFPYLSVFEKLSTDFELGTFYDMGERTGFNTMLKSQNKSLTLLVPNDFSWRQIKKQNLTYHNSEVDVLKRHLIIADAPFSMERLYALGRSTEIKPVELKTAGGLMRIYIHKKESLTGEPTYYIQWYNKLIRVMRPNYECSDGIIHVIAGPLVSLYRTYYH